MRKAGNGVAYRVPLAVAFFAILVLTISAAPLPTTAECNCDRESVQYNESTRVITCDYDARLNCASPDKYFSSGLTPNPANSTYVLG